VARDHGRIPEGMIAATHRKRILGHFRKPIFTRVPFSLLKKQGRVTYPSDRKRERLLLSPAGGRSLLFLLRWPHGRLWNRPRRHSVPHGHAFDDSPAVDSGASFLIDWLAVRQTSAVWLGVSSQRKWPLGTPSPWTPEAPFLAGFDRLGLRYLPHPHGCALVLR
jgi:hypothetical protein